MNDRFTSLHTVKKEVVEPNMDTSVVHTAITMEGVNFDPDDSEMNIVYISDRGGNSIRFQTFEGKFYLPLCKTSILKQGRSLDLRTDDIYMSSFRRTGANWTFEIINMLLNGKAETIPKIKARNHVDFVTKEELGILLSPRLLCSQMNFSDSPQQLLEKKCKIIYTLRDPKDVVVSLYNAYIDLTVCEYQGHFKDFLYLFLEGKVDSGGYFEHIRDAEKFFDDHPEIPVHFQIYEETVKNPVSSIQNLSDFLGLTRNDGLCEAIAEKCQFSRLKADKDAFTFKIDGRSILFRKGIVGDWKNWFTDDMLNDYYQVYEKKMSGSRFYDRYAKEKNY